nr:hypothetical protein [uncultured bacterium]
MATGVGTSCFALCSLQADKAKRQARQSEALINLLVMAEPS